MKNVGYTFGAFLGGALIGAAVALLMAPKSGEDTRKMIRDFVDNEVDKYKGKCGKVMDDVSKEAKELMK